jgi:hypothetical protein
MTVHRVAQHLRMHTCPSHPDGHPWSIERRVVGITETGPCLTPVTRPGGVSLPCARALPSEQRCANCTTVVHVRWITLHVEVTP